MILEDEYSINYILILIELDIDFDLLKKKEFLIFYLMNIILVSNEKITWISITYFCYKYCYY
jgi:hypothetical protein